MTDPNGLLYMRARYYHPGLRRFVNPDPIGFEGGSNWYGYAGGNPLVANDPSGLAVRSAGRLLGQTLAGVPRGVFDYFTEKGIAVGNLVNPQKVIMNGILTSQEKFEEEVARSNAAGFYNPDHGLLADVTQTLLSIVLLGFGDSLGNGFSQFMHQLPSQVYGIVAVHSQATAHVAMQAMWGNLPSGMNIALNSPALNRGVAWIADAFYDGNLHYNQPVGDVANLYTFPLNPFRYLVPAANLSRAVATHSNNA